MGRADFKRGRFGIGLETRSIEQGLRGWQALTGDLVDYWRFVRQEATTDPVYDEGSGAGKVYSGPIALPCLHVVHLQGGDMAGGTVGFYSSDTLTVTVAFRQFQRTGMYLADVRDEMYLRDRMTYDRKVFRLTRITALGQIQRADLILQIEGAQVNADELVDDAQFGAWATDLDNDNTSS